MQSFIFALALVGIVDAISYMVIAPSIVFYVEENGGTKEQYGIILSAFSFASFCTKPFLGHFSDTIGFRIPYFLSLGLSIIGGFLYFIASTYESSTAIFLMLVGRILGGVGAASAALGFAYLAKVVPHDQQTKINSLLSMTRILGMAAGPGFNVFLDKIDANLFGMHVDKLNSVGLVLVVSNLIAVLVIYVLLKEPDESAIIHHASTVTDGENENDHSIFTLVRSVMSLEILVPILSIFAFNANFQLIETGFAPAASHALGWGPIGTSAVLGSLSFIIFGNMIIVFQLSAKKVKDEYLLSFGHTVSAIGYFLIWYMWIWNAAEWKFILPIVIGTGAFPFMAAPTRSIFTKAVDNIESLEGHQGTMQAVLSMASSVAGFTAPGLVAAYVLQDPSVVESSKHHRELSPFALVAPLLSASVLLGLSFIRVKKMVTVSQRSTGDDTKTPDEESPLVKGNKRPPLQRRYSTVVEVERRSTVHLLGISQHAMHNEHAEHDEDGQT